MCSRSSRKCGACSATGEGEAGWGPVFVSSVVSWLTPLLPFSSPQHDALLDLLTVREHLELFARIKGVSEHEVPVVVHAQLSAMDLTKFENKKAGTLSGGNKRKLSVAIALIGSPPIVILDEPTTGVDAVSKRHLWRVISRVAAEQRLCSIILTSHAMEEVQALSTRVGIMVAGRLACIGTQQHLKDRFGSGFTADVQLGQPLPAARAAAAATIVRVLGPATHGPPTLLPRSRIRACVEALGVPDRLAELTEHGTGFVIDRRLKAAALNGSADPTISIDEFAGWWVGESDVAAVTEYLTKTAFPGGRLIERHGVSLRFALPFFSQGKGLSTAFALVEATHTVASIASYALSPTSLEQIFNEFAGKQEAKDQARASHRGAPKPNAGTVEGGGDPSEVAVQFVAPRNAASLGGGSGRFAAEPVGSNPTSNPGGLSHTAFAGLRALNKQ